MFGTMEIPSWILILSTVLVIGIVSILKYIRRNDDYWKKRGIPYMPRYSFFYTMKVFLTMPIYQMFRETHEKYGMLCGGFEGSTPILMIGKPDLLKSILVKDFHAFSSRREMQVKDELMKNFVTLLNGEAWKRVRNIITPAFTSKKMRKIAQVINSCSQTVLQIMDEHATKGKPVDCKEVFGAFSMDVIASSAFATKIDSHHDPNNKFVQCARAVFRPPVYRMLMFFLFPLWLQKLLGLQNMSKEVKFFQHVALQVIEERKKRGQKGNDFLQLMIDASEEEMIKEKDVDGFKVLDLDDECDQYGSVTHSNGSPIVLKNKRLSENEIIAQCILFFIVGYETTAVTLSFLAYCLATNPECQEKLIQEVDEAFSENQELTYDVIGGMKYLDGCVSETLRKFPPIVGGERTAMEDYKLGDTGIEIPKGMRINIPIYGIHHNPEYFPEPDKFQPERFMDESRKNIHQYAYLPFGAGPRNCLGMRFALMEVKLCMANVLRHYRFSPCPETQIPMEFTLLEGFTSPKKIPLTVERRSSVLEK